MPIHYSLLRHNKFRRKRTFSQQTFSIFSSFFFKWNPKKLTLARTVGIGCCCQCCDKKKTAIFGTKNNKSHDGIFFILSNDFLAKHSKVVTKSSSSYMKILWILLVVEGEICLFSSIPLWSRRHFSPRYSPGSGRGSRARQTLSISVCMSEDDVKYPCELFACFAQLTICTLPCEGGLGAILRLR